jgi:hypothetical protein
MATVPDLTLEAGLPANLDAEKTILGAILLDNAAHAEAAEHSSPTTSRSTRIAVSSCA